MDASQNWLAFSLSHQPCFFEAFSSANHREVGEEGELAILAAAAAAEDGPKLEDFLGGCGERVNGETVYDSDLKAITSCFIPSDSAAVALGQDPRKAVDTFGQRTSIYRGVTRHRWTGRYEAHLWDNSCRREGQSRKGRQVYLGGYDKEEKAARAYDLAALKYWGPATTTNFPVSSYEKEMEEMKAMTRQEFVASLRRKSSGFSRGASIYRGVTRHHQHGRWQARIGRVAGNKDLYLGTFSTQEEAAEAYDIAAIKFRGLNAVTNFDMSRYNIKSIMSSNLPIGGAAAGGSRVVSKTCESSSTSIETSGLDAKLHHHHHQHHLDAATTIMARGAVGVKPEDYWSRLALHHQHHHQGNTDLPNYSFYSAVNMDFSNNTFFQGNLWNNNGVLQQYQQNVEEDPEIHQINNYVGGAVPPNNQFGDGGAGGASVGGSNYLGSWVSSASSGGTTPLYYHSGKPSMAFFQTPIYGME